jgi:hypothetical protein
MTENLINTLKLGIFMWYDNTIKDYAEINYKINKIYCEKYGYTLIKSSDRLYPTKKPHWERIPLILENFDNYDYFIWIDADAHFYIDSPPILNIINNYPEKLFIFSGDTDTYKREYKCIINSGVFIVKKSENSKLILNTWLRDDDLFNSKDLSHPVFGSNKWNDQAVLRLMFAKNINNIKDNSIIIDYAILQHFNKTHKLLKQIFGLTDKPFIFHSTNGENMKLQNRIKNSNEYFTSIFLNKYSQYLNSNIQLGKAIITDILINCQNKKMLVFGLGYDSELWYNATNKKTFFIGNNQQYIDLNKNIKGDNIIYHNYNNITVKNSLELTDNQITDFEIPNKILELAPFDIILIDGPTSYNDQCPGRLLPIFWSKTYLSKEGTIIYINDVNRKLEKKCVNKYLLEKSKIYFNERNVSIKVIM